MNTQVHNNKTSRGYSVVINNKTRLFKSLEEISQFLGINHNTLRVKLHRVSKSVSDNNLIKLLINNTIVTITRLVGAFSTTKTLTNDGVNIKYTF